NYCSGLISAAWNRASTEEAVPSGGAGVLGSAPGTAGVGRRGGSFFSRTGTRMNANAMIGRTVRKFSSFAVDAGGAAADFARVDRTSPANSNGVEYVIVALMRSTVPQSSTARGLKSHPATTS